MFLDTTACIDLLREARAGGGPATALLERWRDCPLYLSVFVVCELQAGALLSAVPQREQRSIEQFIGLMKIVYPNADFAIAYAEAEVALRQKGTPIPVMDLLIGVAAKLRGVPLLTRNARHFSLISGLVVESY